ncbi:MAG: hypothetical protein R3E87_23570 [Burkholderiaceae bacterium]
MDLFDMGNLEHICHDVLRADLRGGAEWRALSLSMPRYIAAPLDQFLEAMKVEGRRTNSVIAAEEFAELALQIIELGRAGMTDGELLDRFETAWLRFVATKAAPEVYAFGPARAAAARAAHERRSHAASGDRPGARRIDDAEILADLDRNLAAGKSMREARSSVRARLMDRGFARATIDRALRRAVALREVAMSQKRMNQ